MARRLCAEWQAKWRKRLARFRDRTGTSAEFCQPERFSRSLLSLWFRRLRVPIMPRSRPGTGLAWGRAKPKVDCSHFAPV